MANRQNCKHERVEFLVYRSSGRRDLQSTCQQCGQEWTQTDQVEDLAQTVTADEIISVHELLGTGKPLNELVD